MSRFLLAFAASGAVATLAVACSGSTAPSSISTSVVGVVPRGGATSVPTSAVVTVTFSHAMMPSMQQYMAVHRDSLRGPLVSMTMSWSPDSTILTMMPTAPLAPGTTYVLHMGGGMMDAQADSISYAQCPSLGGVPVTSSMMGGMMGGSEMGPGWMGGNGDFGMRFTFQTS